MPGWPVPSRDAHGVPHRLGVRDAGRSPAELDAWVENYNTLRPHQGWGMAIPARNGSAARTCRRSPSCGPPRPGLGGRAPTGPKGTGSPGARPPWGVVSVSWQQVGLGRAAAGRSIDVWVTDQVLQFYDGHQLLRTQQPSSRGGPQETSIDPPRSSYLEIRCHRTTEVDLSIPSAEATQAHPAFGIAPPEVGQDRLRSIRSVCLGDPFRWLRLVTDGW
jgi:hypothetical protein